MNVNLPLSQVLLTLIVLCYVPLTQAEALFGSLEFKAASLAALPRWERVLEKIPEEQALFRTCDDIAQCTEPSIATWRKFIADNKSKSREDIITAVNAFVNRWPYVTDQKLWGQSDYWASPKEFMINSGDCEDYAILKYVTLKELGFEEDELRLVVVKDNVRNIAHAVLAVYTVYNGDTDIIILDSLFNTPLSHKDLIQYSPYYSVNARSRWAHIAPSRIKE